MRGQQIYIETTMSLYQEINVQTCFEFPPCFLDLTIIWDQTDSDENIFNIDGLIILDSPSMFQNMERIKYLILCIMDKAPRVRISSQFSIFSAYIHTNNYISLCTIHRTDTKVWFWSSMCTHTISFIKVQFILQIYIFDISFLCDLIQE